jgi:hypothetical protein
MKPNMFIFQGIEYQIQKVVELEPEAGKRRIQVTTKDNRIFKLTFNECLFRWEIIELGN